MSFRLYILDTETGDHVLFAKGGLNGWETSGAPKIADFLADSDHDWPAAFGSGSTKLKFVTEWDLEAEIAALKLGKAHPEE